MSFPGHNLQKCWHLVDANGQIVGRLASQIAAILRGKHKPTFLPNKDMGDTVVVINADKIRFSGKKWKEKIYRWHTGYPGGLKERRAIDMHDRKPTEILRTAIFGMLKRTKLRHQAMEPRLHLFAGPTHPYAAQLPLDKVTPLPRVPKKLTGSFHFGLHMYADPYSYQQGLPK